MLIPGIWHKSPDSTLDVAVDFADALTSGDALASGATATVTAADGTDATALIVAGPTVADARVAMRVAGGDAGTEYTISVTAPTVLGQTLAATLTVCVEDSAGLARLIPRVCASPAVDPEHLDYVRELVRQAAAVVQAYTHVTEWPDEAEPVLDAAAVQATIHQYNKLGAEGATSMSTTDGVSIAYGDLDPALQRMLRSRRRLW